MKNAILIGSLVALIFLGVSLVVLYNTQDFKESINFKSEIAYSEIESRFEEDRSKPANYNEVYSDGEIPALVPVYQKVLSFSRAKIGNIELENTGYFTQNYLMPRYSACLVFKNNQNNPINLNFEMTPKVSTYENQYSFGGYYAREEYIQIGVGEKRQIDFFVTFTERYLSLTEESFKKENLDRIDIYEMKKRENNPLTGYNYNYYNQDCNYLTNSVEPDFTIKII